MSTTQTHFAPARRASQASIKALRERLTENEQLGQLADSVPDPLIIVNRDRQIVFANAAFRGAAQQAEEQLLGRRPGEVIRCVHAHKHRGGCGTSEPCEFCGAVQVMLASFESPSQVSREARITLEEGLGGPLEFDITATPLKVGDENLSVLVLRDVSAQKRRQALERVFFHDLLNAASGLQNLTQQAGDPKLAEPERQRAHTLLSSLLDDMIAELEDQRRLMQAERGELVPDIRDLRLRDAVRELELIYNDRLNSGGAILEVTPPPDLVIGADAALLRRVLGNLIKNALEASRPGETVKFWCEADADSVTFFVNNPAVMTPEVQHQIFQRSFSTKPGEGHGLGCYSVKLLGERYLGGKADFRSQPSEGTTFWFRLPTG